MADVVPLVVGPNGKLRQIQPGDTISATVLPANNVVDVSVNFGATFTDYAEVVVTGQTWVTASSVILPVVLVPPGTDAVENLLLDFRIVISNLVPTVGFTLTVYTQVEAKDTYTIRCTGI